MLRERQTRREAGTQSLRASSSRGGSQATEQRERRERVRVDFGVSARFIALWLLLAGCSSEEAINVPNEEETTSTASLP